MSDQDFFFALDLSDEPTFDQMVGDLTLAVLGQVGYDAETTGELTRVLRSALADRVAGGERHCTLRFQATGGQLQVVLAGGDAREWRTVRPLPTL